MARAGSRRGVMMGQFDTCRLWDFLTELMNIPGVWTSSNSFRLDQDDISNARIIPLVGQIEAFLSRPQ